MHSVPFSKPGLKLMCRSVLEHFVTNKLWCKSGRTGSLMHKFVQRCSVRIFRNERTRFTPLGPKLMFSRCLGLFLYCTYFGAKWSELVRRNFSQQTQPIQTVGPQPHVLGCFALFRYNTNFIAKWAELGH
jgi:hypothetical protein